MRQVRQELLVYNIAWYIIAVGTGGEKVTVGREYAGVRGRLRGGGRGAREGTKPRHQYGSDFIISVMVGTEYYSWH